MCQHSQCRELVRWEAVFSRTKAVKESIKNLTVVSHLSFKITLTTLILMGDKSCFALGVSSCRQVSWGSRGKFKIKKKKICHVYLDRCREFFFTIQWFISVHFKGCIYETSQNINSHNQGNKDSGLFYFQTLSILSSSTKAQKLR